MRGHRVLLAVVAVAALCAALPLPAQDEPGTTSGRRSGTLPAAEYRPRPLRGFDVRVHPALLEGEHAEVGGRALDALARDLGDVLDQTPAARHGFLRSVPLFLGVADPVAPCACYHPSARWLERNGFDPAKARAVEITSARTYVDWRRHQPSMVLHELAHALHDQRLRPEQPRLEAALAAVRARGVYDRTLRWSGAEDRHYALNNVDEYFAETTEALFGVNDFHPFVRAELLEVDPRGAALVRALWEGREATEAEGRERTAAERARAEAARAIELLAAASAPDSGGAGASGAHADGGATLAELVADDFELISAGGDVVGPGPARSLLAAAAEGGAASEVVARRLGPRHLSVRFRFGASGAVGSGVLERVRGAPGGLRWLSLQLSRDGHAD